MDSQDLLRQEKSIENKSLKTDEEKGVLIGVWEGIDTIVGFFSILLKITSFLQYQCS